jgi:hypothetical protein
MWAAQVSTASFSARHVDIVLDLADALAGSGISHPRVLSFGCSKGFEPLDLARAMPSAEVLGCDVSPDALAEATQRCGPAGIRIFESTPANLARYGPYDAAVALNVLNRYPAIRGVDDISAVYPFAEYNFSVGHLSDNLNPGGILAIYNSCYLFEQAGAAAAFRPVAPRRHTRNGWTEKHDRSGTRLTSVTGEFEGRCYPVHEWRTVLNREAHRFEDRSVFERLPYQHTPVRPYAIEPDLTTVFWRKVG